jgi:cell division protein FtsQ
VTNELSSVKNALSVLVLALVIALYLFANSPFFETDEIEWTGLTHLSAEQLDLYVEWSATNVWRVDTRELVSVVMGHPWVEQAKATWRWPNRLIVSVRERTPIAQMPISGGWVLLDRDGGLLPPTHSGVTFSLPIVTNLDIESSEQLVATARLICMIPVKLQGTISEWNAATRSFITRTGVEILMGQPVELDQKFVLLEKILEDLSLRNEKAKRIDLRVPKSPVISIL